MEWMVKPYVRYFDFGGRSRRLEFWSWTGFVAVVAGLIGVIATAGYGASPFQSPAYWLFFVTNLIPGVSVGVRRLHDTGRSGFWILISLLPIIGLVWLAVLYLLPGDRGPNRFGPDPLVGRRRSSGVLAEPSGHASVLAQLSDLAGLRERGALTESEFDRLKARLLADAPSSTPRMGTPTAVTPPAAERSSEAAKQTASSSQRRQPPAVDVPPQISSFPFSCSPFWLPA